MDMTSQKPADEDRARGQEPEVLGALGFETLAIHSGQAPEAMTGAVVPPIFAVSTYAQDSVANPRSGYVYGRGSNPTRSALEECLATVENGALGIAFSSGMAAEDAVFRTVCKPGDHVVIPNDVYGGTYRLLDKVFSNWGITFTPAPLFDTDAVKAALIPGKTKLIWCETPTNPLLNIADITSLASVARDANCLLVVDNTFASPYLQRPLQLGADIVVHSTTKYIGGHSDVVGGAVITSSQELGAEMKFHQNSVGAIPSPFDCWLTLRGIKTLGVRMDRQCDSAMRIATMLESHPAVERVFYPGLASHPGHEVARKQMDHFGGVVSFTLRAGETAAVNFCGATRLFTLAESLGAVESLVSHPLRMTHASVAHSTVAPPANLVRLSVGLESQADLIADLTNALRVSAA